MTLGGHAVCRFKARRPDRGGKHPGRDPRQGKEPTTRPAGSLPCLLAPRLHVQRILRHHHVISKAAAALSAAELQILQRAIALAGMEGRPTCRPSSRHASSVRSGWGGRTDIRAL
jgi:hypothetical protein